MKKYFSILIVLALVFMGLKSFAAQYNVYSPTVYKQGNMVPSNTKRFMSGKIVELLVDYSGSMSQWINITMETLEVIVPRIDKNANLGLRVFGDNSVYSSSCKATRVVSSFKKDNSTNVITGLKNTKLGGSTPLEYALRETVEKDLFYAYTPGLKKKIILITDGYDVCGGDPCAYIRQVMKTRKDIVIDVIQMGKGDQLMCLTSATGGRYYTVDGRQRFENAFEQSFNIPQGTVSKERAIKETQVKQQNNAKGYKFINY